MRDRRLNGLYPVAKILHSHITLSLTVPLNIPFSAVAPPTLHHLLGQLQTFPQVIQRVKHVTISGPDAVDIARHAAEGHLPDRALVDDCHIRNVLTVLQHVIDITIKSVRWSECPFHLGTGCWDTFPPRAFHSISLVDITQTRYSRRNMFSCLHACSSLQSLTYDTASATSISQAVKQPKFYLPNTHLSIPEVHIYSWLHCGRPLRWDIFPPTVRNSLKQLTLHEFSSTENDWKTTLLNDHQESLESLVLDRTWIFGGTLLKQR